jgi:5'-methylthioadenosine phosphorylase
VLRAEIGIIGGSGLSDYIDDAVDVEIHTRFGDPTAPISVGHLAGRQVAFFPRHGRRHAHASHRAPDRANVWAMASLGVRAMIAP